MGMLKFGQTVMKMLHVRRSFSSHAAKNVKRPPGKLTVQGYANLAVLCAPFCYWGLYLIDFGGVRTLYLAKRAEEQEWAEWKREENQRHYRRRMQRIMGGRKDDNVPAYRGRTQG